MCIRDREDGGERRAASWRLADEITDPVFREKFRSITAGASSEAQVARSLIEISDMVLKAGDVETASQILSAGLKLVPGNNILRQKIIRTYMDQWKFAEAARLLVEGYQLQHAVA